MTQIILRIKPDFITVHPVNRFNSAPSQVGLGDIYLLRALTNARLNSPQAAIPDLEEAAKFYRSQNRNEEVRTTFQIIGNWREGNFNSSTFLLYGFKTPLIRGVIIPTKCSDV